MLRRVCFTAQGWGGGGGGGGWGGGGVGGGVDIFNSVK